MKRDFVMKRKANESLSGDTGCSSKRDHQNRGFMMQSAFFVTRTNFKRAPGHVKSLHKLRADETQRKCAILKGDEKILALTSRDIVAAEAHYHCSCYKIYTKVKTKEHEHECEKTDRDEWYQREETLCV